MKKLKELHNRIEFARLELNQSLVQDDYEIYYQKSVYLDQLIEEYIELKEKENSLLK